MQRATENKTLYLMVGYPGSGKTTTALVIHDLTGAIHIWADHERQAMFGQPTHKQAESRQLYDHLNAMVAMLLSDGQSVIFDTNFNFKRDRDKMRTIAADSGADCRLIWIKTDKATAFKRATTDVHLQPTRIEYPGGFPKSEFDRLVGNLQPPHKDEAPIVLDGTLITPQYVAKQLGLPKPAPKPAPKKAAVKARTRDA